MENFTLRLFDPYHVVNGVKCGQILRRIEPDFRKFSGEIVYQRRKCESWEGERGSKSPNSAANLQLPNTAGRLWSYILRR